MNIYITSVIDTAILFSVLYAGTFILSLIQYMANRLTVEVFGYRGMLAASFPGVILHETNHLITAILFGHKILRVKFFEPNPESGSLGYVEHSYNQNSFYQTAGNYFIGMAPLIGGSLAIYYLLKSFYFISGDYNPFISFNLDSSITTLANIENNLDYFIVTSKYIMNNFLIYFSRDPVVGGLLFYLLTSIAIHSAPSKSDLKGATTGAVTMIAFVIIMSFVVYFFLGEDNQTIINLVGSYSNNLLLLEMILINFFCFTVVLACIGVLAILVLSLLIITIKHIIGSLTLDKDKAVQP
jgi:hypothetical protein